MGDKELIEHAARAVGYKLIVEGQKLFNASGLYRDADGIFFEAASNWAIWNPLVDDRDVLRLAKALRMTIANEPSRGGWSVGAIVDGEFRWLAHEDSDLNRAIVRSVAALADDRPELPITQAIKLKRFKFTTMYGWDIIEALDADDARKKVIAAHPPCGAQYPIEEIED